MLFLKILCSRGKLMNLSRGKLMNLIGDKLMDLIWGKSFVLYNGTFKKFLFKSKTQNLSSREI